MNKNKIENLKYVNDQTSTSGKPVLCKLKGPVADTINPTRNGRSYSEQLWEKALASELVQESFENGGLLLELGHPVDREEVDYERVAAIMPKPPVKDKSGLLIGEVEVLDTPLGRIANTLAQYGYKLGISSRGTGDVFLNDDGNESVDPDTYDLTTWDLVVLPAVKAARLSPMMESVGSKTLRQALKESLDKSDDKDKQMMLETLNALDIGYNPIKEDDNIKSYNKKMRDVETGATDSGTAEILRSLQEAVKSKAESDAKLLKLQKELAVSDAKVGKIEEELARYKSATVRLSTLAKETKELKETVTMLEEKVDAKNDVIKSQTKRIGTLVESLKETKTGLQESATKKNDETTQLKEELKTSRRREVQSSNKIKELTESVTKLEETLDAEKKKLTEEVVKANKLAENNRKIANDTVRRYINSKAKMLGVTSNEITNRLGESYTIDDIDKICEDLQSYNLNISKLPFNIDRKVKVKVTESKNDALKQTNPSIDDDVDESLLYLAKLR